LAEKDLLAHSKCSVVEHVEELFESGLRTWSIVYSNQFRSNGGACTECKHDHYFDWTGTSTAFVLMMQQAETLSLTEAEAHLAEKSVCQNGVWRR